MGIGAQFGGKYFCHDVRVVRLPRHGASCPVGIGVSCSADRQCKGKITAEGVFLEQLETDVAKYLPEVTDESLASAGAAAAETVKIDLNKPMSEIRNELSKYPVTTRLSLTGTLVVARDIAHAKILERIEAGQVPPRAGEFMHLHNRVEPCVMFCLTLVPCSSLLCLSWTILSTKMHSHMFPLPKMLCKTMKFFHCLKMRKNVLSLPLPNARGLAVPGSLSFAIPPASPSRCIVLHCALPNPRPVRARYSPPAPPCARPHVAHCPAKTAPCSPSTPVSLTHCYLFATALHPVTLYRDQTWH